MQHSILSFPIIYLFCNPADLGHPQRGSVELSTPREDQGAQGDTGLHHHHHPKGGGTTAHLLMKEAPPHPRGMADNSMGAPTQGAGAPWMMMLKERPPRLRAPLRKMAAAPVLAPSVGTMQALLVTTMRTVALLGPAYQFKM